ncbi:MAG: hypothetical protein LBD13_01865 [Spirochaetaceae bacterium]|nr:hypothetical protein [Spirochaetaceae bacterium]
MEILAGIGIALAVLAAVLFTAKRFLNPAKGPLPDCCGGRRAQEQPGKR